MPPQQRHLCIHGHFYQPPRENPWLEAIELQDSAVPYHDWNERIEAECYGPNAAARILDDEGRISRIVNNYSRISFDFGPTLLSWLAEKAPSTYEAVLEADRASMERFSGHGSAMAQAYNHMILPLASRRDKITQVAWGVRDFELRFGRQPEGMWLPETAVDRETLEVLAECGVRFTVLAQHQAARFRKIGDGEWEPVPAEGIDPGRAYRANLPSGRSIDLFFYHGAISRAVAFEQLLNSGDTFAQRLVTAYSDTGPGPQLAHIATDGESYGHHHRFGEMALAYALHSLENRDDLQLTNYSRFLAEAPPEYEVEIREDTSWSCAHGIGRWIEDCGCHTGAGPGWNQRWRTPLRRALDHLRDRITPLYETAGGAFLNDPWRARDEYIEILFDRSADSVDRFLQRHAGSPLAPPQRQSVMELLEMQRHAMLMYTSCGWFFNDIAGIETLQILQYASRALQLARHALDVDLEPDFLELLREAKSNRPECGDGRRIYLERILPARVDLHKVGARCAVSALFEDHEPSARAHVYEIERSDCRTFEAGRARAILGRMKIIHSITGETSDLSGGAIHLGDHNLVAGVCDWPGEEAHRKMVEEVEIAFSQANLPRALFVMDRYFPGSTYSLDSLFLDERRQLLDRILESTLEDVAAVYRRLYRQHAPLIRFLRDLDAPLPGPLQSTAEFVLNTDLRIAFQAEQPDAGGIRKLLEQASREKVKLDTARLQVAAQQWLDRTVSRFGENPGDENALQAFSETVRRVLELPFDVNLKKARDLYYSLRLKLQSGRWSPPAESEAGWTERFSELGEILGFAPEGPEGAG